MVLFTVYIVLLIYFLFFSEGYRRCAQEERIYHYNLKLFTEIQRFWIYREQLGIRAFVTNVLGNVAGFVPYGFIFPIISSRMRSFWLILLSGLLISLTVETIQLLTRVGSFDVDDLFLNTLGVAVGGMAFSICDRIRRQIYGKKV